jgi:uncharacterized protein YkwD
MGQIGVVVLLPVLLALGVALGPGPGLARAESQPPPPPGQVQSRAVLTIYLPVIRQSPTPERQLLEMINTERLRLGLSRLTINPLLMQAAEAHSQDMINRNFFSHTNPDGATPGDRLDAVGYNWWTWGETIGAGYATPQAMFTGWMNSSGHRDIMLSANYTEIGLGYVTGGAYGHYWTADFGRPGS